MNDTILALLGLIGLIGTLVSSYKIGKALKSSPKEKKQ